MRVDGIVGPETTSAIANFQTALSTGSDARIDPGGPTLLALLRQHFQAVADQLTVQSYRYSGAGDVRPIPVPRAAVECALDAYFQQLKSLQEAQRAAPSAPPDGPYVA